MHSELRELTSDELNAVSGGDVISNATVIRVITDKGTLVIGYLSTDGGPSIPFGKWTPK